LGAALTSWAFPWRYPLSTRCGVCCGFPAGSFTVAHATLGGHAADDLVDECGEVAGGVEIAIEHESALLAAVGPFGKAQLGFHHTTGRTRF
jgi:hypothetical protein